MPGTTYVEQLNIVEPLETDGGSGESLVRSPDGKIRKGTGGGGGSQNLQQTLDNGSEGTVDTDIILTHGSGANTAMLGLTDGYVSASAGDNQFGLNEQEGSFTSQLRIFERLILMSGGSSGEVAFAGTEINYLIDGSVIMSIDTQGKISLYGENDDIWSFYPHEDGLKISENNNEVLNINTEGVLIKGTTLQPMVLGSNDFGVFKGMKFVDDGFLYVGNNPQGSSPGSTAYVEFGEGAIAFTANNRGFGISNQSGVGVLTFFSPGDYIQTQGTITETYEHTFPLKDGFFVKSVSVNGGTPQMAGSDGNVNVTVSGGATNLTYTASPTNGVVNSDTGTDATIPLGDITNAGLLSPADKAKLNNTSGTNSGDNATNTTSNTYADGKVADNLTASTTVAPSKTAVNTALALKQDISTLSEAIRTSMFAVSSTTNTGSMNPLLGLADNLKRLENRINLLGTSTSQKTAAYGITASDFFVELTANTATFTLPTAVGVAGKQYIVKNSGTGVLTLATSSSQTIDGMATKNINTQYMGYRVISDGANWKIIGAF